MSLQAMIAVALTIVLVVFFVVQRVHKSGDPEDRPAPAPEPEPEPEPREVPMVMSKQDAHRPIAGRGE